MGVYGKGGSGKNTITTYLLAKHFKGYKKYVNFDLNLPNTTKIDSIKLFELDNVDIKDLIFVVWDEAYTEGLDNRDAMTDENKIQSYLLFQARKKNFNIISIAQLNMLDTRWRQLEESFIYCYPRPIYDKHFNHYKGDFHYAYYDGKRVWKYTLKYKEALKVFQYFKTEKAILPKDFDVLKRKAQLKNPKGVIEYVNEITNCIITKYGIGNYTHNKVKSMMLDLEYVDFAYEKYVYLKLQDMYKETEV